MATITRGQEFPRHVRSTIAFDGTGGNGAVGTVDVFTITGRVYIARFVAYCTENLTEGGATATIELGGATDINGLLAQVTATALDNTEWWHASGIIGGLASLGSQATSGATTSQIDKVTDEDIILTVGTQSVDDGTVIFDCWYTPITDGASLVAA